MVWRRIIKILSKSTRQEPIDYLNLPIKRFKSETAQNCTNPPVKDSHTETFSH